MSTTNEVAVMRLALEALKIAQNNLAPSKHSAHVFGDGELWDMYADAIKALEEALASEQEQVNVSEQLGEPLEYWNAVEGWVKLDEVREHFDSVSCATIYKNGGEGRVPLCLAKQEQGEPVALKVYRGELCYKSQADDQSFGMWCPVTKDLPFPEGTRLYTTPQQRTWVGLTEEEVEAAYWHTNPSLERFAHAIEAKLKAKNERLEKNT